MDLWGFPQQKLVQEVAEQIIELVCTDDENDEEYLQPENIQDALFHISTKDCKQLQASWQVIQKLVYMLQVKEEQIVELQEAAKKPTPIQHPAALRKQSVCFADDHSAAQTLTPTTPSLTPRTNNNRRGSTVSFACTGVFDASTEVECQNGEDDEMVDTAMFQALQQYKFGETIKEQEQEQQQQDDDTVGKTLLHSDAIDELRQEQISKVFRRHRKSLSTDLGVMYRQDEKCQSQMVLSFFTN